MRRMTRYVLVAFLLASLTGVGPATPASADDGKAQYRFALRPSGDASIQVTCSGIATAPHTSGGTVQWEVHIVCDKVGSLFAGTNIYTVIGTGDRTRRVFQEQATDSRVGSWLDGYHWDPCNGNTSTRWIANVYATFNGITFEPYPAWSPTVTIPCAGFITS